MRLQGKVAIVTGGALGIGEAYSLGMAKEGASVVVADLDDKAGGSVAAGINASGGKALFVKTDISRKAEAERLVAETVKKFGRLDILVNNAGILFTAPVLETTEEMWDKLLAVNVKGLFFCAAAAAREMIKGKEREDHQHLLDRGGRRAGGAVRLQLHQGGRSPPDPRLRTGAGPAQHPGQRHPARDDGHGYGQGGHGGPELDPADHGRHSHEASGQDQGPARGGAVLRVGGFRLLHGPDPDRGRRVLDGVRWRHPRG